MHKHLGFSALATLALTAAMTAQADVGPGFYVGAGFRHDGDLGREHTRFQRPTTAMPASRSSAATTFNEYFADIEASYFDFGEASGTIEDEDPRRVRLRGQHHRHQRCGNRHGFRWPRCSRCSARSASRRTSSTLASAARRHQRLEIARANPTWSYGGGARAEFRAPLRSARRVRSAERRRQQCQHDQPLSGLYRF